MLLGQAFLLFFLCVLLSPASLHAAPTPHAGNQTNNTVTNETSILLNNQSHSNIAKEAVNLTSDQTITPLSNDSTYPIFNETNSQEDHLLATNNSTLNEPPHESLPDFPSNNQSPSDNQTTNSLSKENIHPIVNETNKHGNLLPSVQHSTQDEQTKPPLSLPNSNKDLPPAANKDYISTLSPPTPGQILQIQNLLKLNSNLEKALQLGRLKNLRAATSLEASKSRKISLLSEHADILTSRQNAQHETETLHQRLPRYDTTIGILKSKATGAIREIEALRTRKFWLVQKLRKLEDELRERGLERWVEGRVKDSVNPAVANALIEGTASVVEPMLDRIERFAEAESELEYIMKSELKERVPLVDSPFYSGFVSYVVLLCPLVLVTSVLIRVRRGVAKIGLLHVSVLGNFYFAVLCAGCFGATIVGKVDVLLTLRKMNGKIFDTAMVLHGAMFIVHLLLHGIVAARVRTSEAVSHALALTAVGLHFFIHSWSHAIRHEDPHVDRYSYLVYTGIFLFVLYELTIKKLRKEQEKKVMTLNNTSISARDNDLAVNVSSAGAATHGKEVGSSVTTHLQRDDKTLPSSAQGSTNPPGGGVSSTTLD